MKRIMVAGCMLSFAFATNAQAADREEIGTDIAIALPLVAGGITLSKQDWTGSLQLIVDTSLTVGTAYALKKVIHEQRPDKSDNKSFPSDTAALAFAPAQFLWDRYGWRYGLPAYLTAGLVAWSRVDQRRHHSWDVVASAAIAFGYSKLITTEYRGNGFYSSAGALPGGGYVNMGWRW